MLALRMEEIARLTRTDSSPLPKWAINTPDFGIMIAFVLASMVVGTGLAGQLATYLAPASESDEPSNLVPLAQNLGMQFGMLGGFLGFCALLGGRSASLTPPSQPIPIHKKLLVGLALLLASYFAIGATQHLLDPILVSWGFEKVTQEPVLLVQQGGTALERALLYATIIVVAPICEEFVFRGGIFRYLHRRMPLALSAGISGLVFASIHGNLFVLAPLTILGAAFAIAYRLTGSLFTCIFMHAVFNSLSLFVIINYPELAG